MSKRKTSRHKQLDVGARRRPIIVIAVAIQPGYSTQHPYSEPRLVQYWTTVKAQHVTELRNRVK